MPEPKERPFWIVWSPTGRNPQYKHGSEVSAQREAERLARENAGQRFVVMQSVDGYVAEALVRVDLRPCDEADIPF